MRLTRELILAIETGGFRGPEAPLIEHAAKNKVLLHFLRRTGLEGPIREAEERRRLAIERAAASVAERLSGLNYALMKFVKPVAYVPADVDVLVSAEDAPFALRRIEGLGYRALVREPYCVTLTGSAIVDVYLHPCMANVPFMDGEGLLRRAREVRLDGVRAMALAPEAEAVVAAAHAVYKEQLFTLNDYFTIREWLTEEALEVAREARVEPALSLAVSLAERVERGEIEAPYKIRLPSALVLLASKFARDALSRASALRAALKLRDARLGAHIKSRLIRGSY